MHKTSPPDEVELESRGAAFNARLEELVGDMALAAWADKHGINSQTLYNLKGKMPGLKLLLQIQAATGRSLDWLLGLSDEGRPVVTQQTAGDDWSDFVRIPIYDVHASAGHGAFAPGREKVSKYLCFRHDFLSKELRITKNGLYCVRVRGVSMEPILRDGHPALIDPNDTEVLTEGPHFLRLEGALLLKNLQRLPGGRLRIWSENQTTNAFAPIEMDWPAREDVDLQIFGRIRWSDHTF